MPSSRVALVGLMGAGKSRVGRHLAALLKWPFFDADTRIEERTGMSIEELFRTRGEAAFRDLEVELLTELSNMGPPFVAALGGGIVERPENRELLKTEFFTVWLKVDPDRAAERLGRGAGRPLLYGRSPGDVLAELERRRGPWYLEVAQLIVDTNTAEASDLGRTIAARLRSH
jgi:shikimate kinase